MVTQSKFKEYDLIIEATASTAVFRMLTKVSTKCNVPIARFALSDAGKSVCCT